MYFKLPDLDVFCRIIPFWHSQKLFVFFFLCRKEIWIPKFCFSRKLSQGLVCHLHRGEDSKVRFHQQRKITIIFNWTSFQILCAENTESVILFWLGKACYLGKLHHLNVKTCQKFGVLCSPDCLSILSCLLQEVPGLLWSCNLRSAVWCFTFWCCF